MSKVTVRAAAHVLGLDPGATATVERTKTVQAHIDQGYLTVVDEPKAEHKPEHKPEHHTRHRTTSDQ